MRSISLAASLALLLCLVAFPASAGPTYAAHGAICTSGTAPDIGLPPYCTLGGPPSITIEMADGYVPGTTVGLDQIAGIDIYDGFFHWSVDTGFLDRTATGSANMPAHSGGAGGFSFSASIYFAFLLDAGDSEGPGGGDWGVLIEIPGLGPGPCGIHFYCAAGEFSYWVRTDIPAPEPATFALVGIGLAGLGFARRRK